jgi:DNA repair exonuclease SbcCD ATPase subunit
LQDLLLKLREISRAKSRQILIVTHEEQLKGFLDHVITIPR